jgi:hypothetical protein
MTPGGGDKEMKRIAVFLCLIVLLFSLLAIGGQVRAASGVTFTATELLGCPTGTSITVNVVPSANGYIYFEYGMTTGSYFGRTSTATLTSGKPTEVVISGLAANTKYYYRMESSPDGSSWTPGTEHSFYTQRAAGSTFKFTVTADSHAQFNTAHQNAMTNILNEHPDFNIDLGDTFCLDGTTSQSAVNSRYLAYRNSAYMGKIGPSVPIFLASGNHEDEEGWNLDDTPFSIAVGSIQARKAYFPTPIDGGFYSGNIDPLAAINAATYGDQYREDYYAWRWGDALFVVIDEFQYTMNLPYAPGTAGEGTDDAQTGDQWSWTLGAPQYQWLKTTLQNNSDAKYKFIFSHQMLGGIPRSTGGVGAGYVRGGAEAAAYFEWGGYNADGTTWGFGDKRPGWDKPIHQLMVDYGVSAYFHGHDHQYVYETRDGIVYQELPSPSLSGSGFSGIYTAGNHGTYNTIKILPNSGHLLVTVAPDHATVDYISSTSTAGKVNYTYNITPGSSTSPPTAPSNLTATAVSAAQINVSWQDNSGDETGFKIERRSGADAYAQIATTNANSNTYNDTSLSPSTTYYYRVKAYNTNGDSTYSNEVSATTLSPQPPVAPSNLAATAVSTTQINLSWLDNSGDETGFKIERKTGASGTYAQIATTIANITVDNDSGLSPSTTYYYRVRAYNANGNSAYSNEASATTLSPPTSSNLALNKTAKADSERTSSGNTAGKGNDGNSSTRWSANDGRLNHWWKVDLGASYTLTGTKVMFQYARNYKYKIEVSMDNINWTVVVNQTTNTSTAQTRQDSFSATGRYVRITYTGLPYLQPAWASHYEFEVYGY